MTSTTEDKRREIMGNVRYTCTGLASKLEQLHRRVIKPVEQAKDAVASTVETVTESVSSAKHAVDTVGEQVAKHPWLAILGGIAAGVGAGLLTGRRCSAAASAEASTIHPEFNGSAAFIPPPVEKPGFLNKQFNKLTGVAVGAGLAVVRDLVKERMPAWADAADSITSDLTEQMGAVPFTGPILPNADPYSASVN